MLQKNGLRRHICAENDADIFKQEYIVRHENMDFFRSISSRDGIELLIAGATKKECFQALR